MITIGNEPIIADQQPNYKQISIYEMLQYFMLRTAQQERQDIADQIQNPLHHQQQQPIIAFHQPIITIYEEKIIKNSWTTYKGQQIQFVVESLAEAEAKEIQELLLACKNVIKAQKNKKSIFKSITLVYFLRLELFLNKYKYNIPKQINLADLKRSLSSKVNIFSANFCKYLKQEQEDAEDNEEDCLIRSYKEHLQINQSQAN